MTISNPGIPRPDTRIGGLIPVIETPFHPDGSIDADGFARVVEGQLSAGADGLMFPGFASEFSKLSDGERSELEGVLLAHTSGTGILGIVSTPDHSTYLATKRVERVIGLGADAINVLPPYLLAPSAGEVIAHLDAVLDAAQHIPVIIQLAPALAGTSLRIEDLQRLAARHENLAAIKVESVPPGPTVSALLGFDPPMPSVIGYAGLHLIDALRRGAVGVQPGASFPELYRNILDAWNGGDESEAESIHRDLQPFLAYWMQNIELVVQVEKRISMRRGWIASDTCRRPGRPLDEFEEATVERFLQTFAGQLGL
jgi:4-hydroxy-tetrahydrodipicolinate synthase